MKLYQYIHIFFLLQEWDQVSAYSGRSIPRPRIYPVDNQDDMRSNFSGMPGKVGKARYVIFYKLKYSSINITFPAHRIFN